MNNFKYTLFLILIITFLFICFMNKIEPSFLDFNESFKSKHCKILISYSYYEKENTMKNLDFFLVHGLKENMSMIINCKSKTFSLDLNKYKYKNNIILLKTKNKGFDFGAHKQNLEYTHLKSEYKHQNIYEYFKNNNFNYIVLMNDSCIGPFVKHGNWYTPFINKDSELVGTINLYGYFIFVEKTSIHKIYDVISKHKMNSYQDAVNVEYYIRNKLKATKKNLTNLKYWSDKHNPFEVIFVKENRINKNLGSGKIKFYHKLNYISKETLNHAVDYMNLRN